MKDYIPVRVKLGDPIPMASLALGFKLALEMEMASISNVSEKSEPVVKTSPSPTPAERAGDLSQMLLFR